MLGPDHPITADARSALAQVLWQQGKLAGAAALYERALASFEAELGPDDPQTLVTLTFLGFTLQEAGRAAEALPHVRRTLEAYERLFGPDHEETAARRHLVASLLYDLGEWEAARIEFERALAVREAVLGRAHPMTGVTLNALGMLLGDLGRLREARELLERSLSISERDPDTTAANLGVSYDNLASLTWRLGDYKTARKLSEKAVALLETEVGPDAIDTAIARSMLANILQAQGELGAARAALERALPVLLDHPDPTKAATVHGNLSSVAWMEGDVADAKAYAEKALADLERALGRDHPETSTALQNLAILIGEAGDLAKAEELLEEALAVQVRTGSQLERVTLANLALFAHRDGRTDDTLDYLERALEAEERLLVDVLATGSERDKQLFIERDRSTANWAVQYQVLDAPDDPRALHIAVTSVLRRKGRALDATAAARGALRRNLGVEARDLYDRSRDLRERRARMQGARTAPDDTAGADLEELEREIEWMSKELVSLAPLAGDHRPVTVEAVRSRLPPDAALIEITSYWPHEPTAPVGRRHGERRYAVYVLANDRPTRFVDLGPAAVVDEAALAFREALARRQTDVLARGRALDELTFARIRPLLAGAQRLVLAPDGELNLTPFAPLPNADGRYLIEDFELSWVTSGRDLLSSSPAGPLEPALLVGDAAFGEPATRTDDDSLGGLTFGPLPATGAEVEALAATLGVSSTRVLTGERATEAAVKAVRSPRVLHLATHGFFTGEIEAQAPAAPGTPLAARDPPLDSLTSAGLALATFNQRVAAADGNDGVLSALEVIDLELAGTEIVALSACETGLGAVRDGQGVFGLRRALVLAGAKSQLMTLWQVADEATKELMVAWYGQLAAGRGRAEALRAVQLAALRGEPLPATGEALTRGSSRIGAAEVSDPRLAGSRHPFYWAGFILSGEPGPLPELLR